MTMKPFYLITLGILTGCGGGDGDEAPTAASTNNTGSSVSSSAASSSPSSQASSSQTSASSTGTPSLSGSGSSGIGQAGSLVATSSNSSSSNTSTSARDDQDDSNGNPDGSVLVTQVTAELGTAAPVNTTPPKQLGLSDASSSDSRKISDEPTRSMEDLSIPDEFNYKSDVAREISIDISALSTERAYVSIYSLYSNAADNDYTPNYNSRITASSLDSGTATLSYNLSGAQETILAEVWFYDGSDPVQQILKADQESWVW